MSNRKPHMEDWLQQAAAQAPEITPAEVKQQAWGQLNNMLDKADEGPRSGTFPWWLIILGILVLLVSLVYFYAGSQSMNSRHPVIYLGDEQQNRSSLSFSIDSHPQQGNVVVEKSISALIDKKDGPWNPLYSFIDNKQQEAAATDQHIPASIDMEYNHETDQAPDSIDNKNGPQQEGPATDQGPFTSMNKKEHDLKSASTTIGKQNLPTPQSGKPPVSETDALLTLQLFIPIKDSGLFNIPAIKVIAIQKKDDGPTGFSLKLATYAPIAEAYGIGGGIAYTFKWKKKWRIRPYLGAEYLTGFNKTYEHSFYKITMIPGGPPGGPAGSYRTDSILTLFQLKGLMYGKAGMQAAYAFSKWEVSAGVEYRYLLKSFGKDAIHIQSAPGIDQTPGQAALFNKKQVTGNGNVRLQFGLDYMIRRRLQIGAAYYVQLTRHTIDTTYKRPLPKLPDQTSLEIHARFFLRKR